MVAERWHPETRVTDLWDVPAWVAGLTSKDVADHWADVLIECLFDDESGAVRDINRRAFCLAIGAIRAKLRGTVLVRDKNNWMPRAETEQAWRARCQEAAANVGDVAQVSAMFRGGQIKRVREAAAQWPEFELVQIQRRGTVPAWCLRRVAA